MASKSRKKTIYDNGGITVEQTLTDDEIIVSKPKNSIRSFNETRYINVLDAIDTFAGYMNNRFSLNYSDGSSGECVICGKSTMYPRRKICTDCFDKYGAENILRKVKTAVENMEASFTIDVE